MAEVIGVAGDGAPLWLLARAADLTEAEAAEAADAMVEAGLLATADPAVPSGSPEWVALAGDPGSAGRHATQRRIARLWAQTAGGVEIAAGHLLAVPPGGQDWIAPFLLEAARVATGEGRHEDALLRLERAAEEPAGQSSAGGAADRAGRRAGAHGPGRCGCGVP